MITPLVYEVHDDNDPRHIYTHDSVRGIIDKLYMNDELYSIKWYFIKYVPVFILNILPISVALSQSIAYKVKFTIRVDVSKIIKRVALPRHMTRVINNNLNAYVYNIRNDL